jgi:C_GCAxxG_C_C family probable redox protein
LLMAPTQDHAEFLELIGDKAANLFHSGEMLCAPAVLVTLNEVFMGGLDDQQARALASALPVGMGGAGCTCGALSGAQMALGLFLGSKAPWRKMAPKSQEMHDLFKERFASTCCRVLSKKLRDDPKAHKAFCVNLTGEATKMAAQIILSAKPELAKCVKRGCLLKRSTRLAVGVKRLVGMI